MSVVGVRADESRRRASLDEWQIEPGLDAILWRPLLRWSVDDVIAIHHRHGIAPNPLYLRGMERVGCWPCLNACKAEYAAIAKDDRRADSLRAMERIVGDLQHDLGRITEGRRRPAWHFGDGRPGAALPLLPPIDTVFKWAATDHGGRQMPMFDDPNDDGGCVRWGLCESQRAAF